MLVDDARRRYIDDIVTRRALSTHTIRAYDGDVRAFQRFLGGSALTSQIESTAVVGFFEDQRARGIAARSIRRRASALRGFGAWLTANDLLQNNPFVNVQLRLRLPKRLPRNVSSSSLDRLLDRLCAESGIHRRRPPKRLAPEKADQHTTLLAVVLMLTTGVRVHEVVTLERAAVDLDERTVRIVGKGRRERVVFLTNDWVRELARAYIFTREHLEVPHQALLFNRHRALLTTAAMRTRLRLAGERAGVSDRVTPHMLRHSAATQLIEAGVDIRFVQRLLGHASLTTTELYTHIADSALQRVVSEADILGRRHDR